MKTLDKAQKFIEFSSLSLEGEQDFVPFVIVADDKGKEFFVAFPHMPAEAKAKDQIADMIMALCVIHGAVEVSFGSAAWSVEDKGDNDLPPSKRPDRKEVAIISAADSAGVKVVRIASMVREGDKVGIGLWEQLSVAEAAVAAGRFAEALHMGIKLSKQMPPELRDFLREQIEAGLLEEILSSTIDVINEARRTALTIEKGEWK
jgi:hypothetical protein